MKNVFLFHLKSSYRSRDIHIFVIFSVCTLSVKLNIFLGSTSKAMADRVKKREDENAKI